MKIVPYTDDLSTADWLASKKVIETMLRELCPHLTEAHHDHNSSAIIARLANANPVLFIVRADCIAWEDELLPSPRGANDTDSSPSPTPKSGEL